MSKPSTVRTAQAEATATTKRARDAQQAHTLTVQEFGNTSHEAATTEACSAAAHTEATQVTAVAAQALASVAGPPAKKSRPTPLDLFFATITEQPYRDPFASVALIMLDMGISNSDAADILQSLARTITKTAEKSAMRTKNLAAQETPK